MSRTLTVLRAWCELLRYDLLQRALRMPGVAQPLLPRPSGPRRRSPEAERAIVDAFTLATCFYWKRVLCLQRSVCLVRLLRAADIDAVMVIGYRPAPFQSHAWVEVGDCVVCESPAYRERLRILHVA